MEDRTILVTTKDGKEEEAKLLFSFELDGTDFVLYELSDAVYAAKYDDKNNLKAVLEDEWPMVEKIYNEYMEDHQDELEDN